METLWREVRSIEEEVEGEEEDETERKSMDGNLRADRPPLSVFPPHLSLSSRGGAGGGVACGGGAVLLSNRRGHAPGNRGAAVDADAPANRHREEEAARLQRDPEEQKQTANQRRAGHLHGRGPAHLDTKTGCR